MSLSAQEQILQSIKKSNNILISMKKDYETDSICSALALAKILEKLKKDVNILVDGYHAPQRLKFIPKINQIFSPEKKINNKFTISLDLSKTKIDEFSYDIVDDKLNIHITPKGGNFVEKDVSFATSSFNYDLIFVIDTNSLDELEGIYENNTDFFFKTPIINLDHIADNERFGQINHVDLTATSTCEVIYDLFFPKNLNLLDEDIATTLLCGIISDTKSFQTPQVTPKTLNIVSQLIAAGAKREEIIQNLYRTKSISTLKIWGKILMNLEYKKESKLVWSNISYQDVQKFNIKKESLIEIIDELITHCPQAQTIILSYELEPNKINSLIYTEKNLNSLDLVKNFNPKGNKHLATIQITPSPLKEAEEKIINEVSKNIDLIPQF